MNVSTTLNSRAQRARGDRPVRGRQMRLDESRFLLNTYQRPAPIFVRGRGCYLFDEQGRQYLDFLSGIGVNALGYAHPRLVRVMQQQCRRAVHISNLFHHPHQGRLARELARLSGLARIFLTNSGSEAVEAALKLARLHARQGVAHGPDDAANGKNASGVQTRILALENSFHGRTFGALSVTAAAKYREPFGPLVPGVDFVAFNDCAALQRQMDSSVCAIILEPMQGEGGIFAVSQEFWSLARALTRQHRAALIADEIQCGLGRTGRVFAYQKFSETPDMVVVAKPLAGGLPLGAVMASEEFARVMSPGLHGSTFGGGPLCCAAALAFLSTLKSERLLENIRARGAELQCGMEQLAKRFDFVREIRGEGLMWAMDLNMDGAPIVELALRQGLLINCTHNHILRFLPPFTINRQHTQEFLRKLEIVFIDYARKSKRHVPSFSGALVACGPAADSLRKTSAAVAR